MATMVAEIGWARRRGGNTTGTWQRSLVLGLIFGVTGATIALMIVPDWAIVGGVFGAVIGVVLARPAPARTRPSHRRATSGNGGVVWLAGDGGHHGRDHDGGFDGGGGDGGDGGGGGDSAS